MSNFWIMGDDMIVMMSEEDMDVRKIYMNAEHPKKLEPQPNGHSIGHWEGDKLIVDSIGFKGDESQHVVETIYKEKSGEAWHLVREVATTSNGQTRNQTFRSVWRPDIRWYENVCEENYTRFEIVDGEIVLPATLEE